MPDSTPAATSVLLLLTILVCAVPSVTTAAQEADGEVILTGEVAREEIERAVPAWVGRGVEARIDAADATALASVDPGATITIYLGTWCSDSAREVSRFWRALDQVGGIVPFEVRYVAVDRAENRPPELVEEVDLRYVPTFVVRRDGREVGRVVEVSPHGIETDLLALLTGRASGVISAREDLGGP
jgi:hypothetical protein